MTENQPVPQTQNETRVVRDHGTESAIRTVRWTDLIDDPEERKRLGLR